LLYDAVYGKVKHRHTMAARKPTKPPEQPTPLQTYGLKLDGPQTQLAYDRAAFALNVPIDKGAPPKNVLFWRIADRLVPGWFERHAWTQKIVDAICAEQWIGFAGCSNSAKTRNIAGFACLWWLAYPEESAVIFCSTTAKALRRRGWAEVQNFHTSIPGPRVGNFVDSMMQWQSVRGDSKHCVMGLAVEDGSTIKASDSIKGFHTKRLMIVVDEATAVPQAITEAATNMWSYPKEFVFIMIGNPRSRLDEFGKFIQPNLGWEAVSVETEEWETTPKLNNKPGVCVRFDAEKSPNIVEGRLVSKHLPTKEKIESWKLRLAKLGAENDPSYFSNARGFPPPEGLEKTVFSESAILAYGGSGRHQFTGSNFHIIGALDPARAGGDRPALRFAALGDTTSGKWGIEWCPPIVVSLDARSKKPLDYQLTDAVRKACENVVWRGEKYVCLPENFAVDATGGGADLCDIMQHEWSERVMRIVFSGSPSDDAVSYEDLRPSSDIYRNKRVEMYWRTRKMLDAEQLKGIDVDTAKELCSIVYDDSKALMQLMSKADYRERFGKSPDFADCAIMLTEIARWKGFRLAPVGRTATRQERVSADAHAADDALTDITYSEQDPEELYEALEP
jgi:hypothetical protein